MPAPFFIVGPTAVGKSSLALKLAEHYGTEIIGADAFQIYAGFDLLTAKPSMQERQRVPHHLIGTVSPADTYNVARYLNDAQSCLESISARSKSAIVVGGTGLYVKALTHGLSPLPEADLSLRLELEPLDSPTLLKRLCLLDPVAASTIDIYNKRRLIRAIEVCLLTGDPFSKQQTLWSQPPSDQQSNGVFLTRSKDELQMRIVSRIQQMFAAGVVEEARIAQKIELSPTSSRMIGWSQINDYLQGNKTLAECQTEMMIATRQYAKRQVTWFQREKHFSLLDLSAIPDERKQMDILVELFERHTAEATGNSPEKSS